MTITPFLVVPLKTRRDALCGRQRGRRVASILQYTPHEQACIAAGTFVVACQALERFDSARLIFQIENRQLHVFCESEASSMASPQQISDALSGANVNALMRLTKPLPPQPGSAEELDLGWLLKRIEESSHESLFDEVVKQNQEILGLLHEIRLYQANNTQTAKNGANISAA